MSSPSMISALASLVIVFFLALSCNPIGGTQSTVQQGHTPGLPPVMLVNLSGIPAALAGDSVINLQLGLPMDMSQAKLKLIFNDGTSSEVATFIVPVASYLWTIPKVDENSVKLVLEVTTKAGTKNEVQSNLFSIDSTPPTPPAVVLTSTTPTNLSQVSFHVDSCDDRPFIFVGETTAAPVTSSAGWRACSGSMIKTLSAAQGVRTLYVWARDAVGNVSLINSSFSLTFDSTAPSLAFVAAPQSTSKLRGGVSFGLSWTGADSGSGLTGYELFYSPDGGSFTSVTTLAPTASSYSWSTPVVNVSSAQLRLVATDLAGNSTVVTTAGFIIDSTAPTVSLSSPPGLSRGGSQITLLFSSSDSLSGVASQKLQYATDGVTFVDVETFGASATSTVWTVPSSDATGAKLRLVTLDGAGNEGVGSSTAFEIDSTPPMAPSVSLSSSNPTNSTTAAVTVTSCSDRAKIFISENPSTPLWNASGWIPCASSLSQLISSTDGTKTLYAWAQDSAGNTSTPSQFSFVLDQTPPGAPAIVFSNTGTTALTSSSTTSNLTISSCTDRSHVLITESVLAPAPGDAGWVPCSTSAGGLSFSLPHSSEGPRALRAWVKDGAGNVSTSWTALTHTLDTTPPSILATSINSGALNVSTPFVTVTVSAVDAYLPISIRMQEANGALDCQSQYANNSWVSYSGTSQSFSFQISTGDGIKKVCVWARDSAGNVTVMNPSAGVIGVDAATINYFVGFPPVITSLAVSNNRPGVNFGTQTYATGDPVNISWAVNDQEGLADTAIALFVTTNNSTWTQITGSYGTTSGNPTTHSGSFTGYTAPGTGYFRIRAIAYDRSGNTSIPVLSDTQNTAPWSIWAGSTDRGVGGSGRGAILRNAAGGDTPKVAVHPQTNDIYAIDDFNGLRKLDAKTGIVSTIVTHGTHNLGESGTLSSSSRVNLLAESQLAFDRNGFLYVSSAFATQRFYLYRINTETNAFQRYLGGGFNFDTGASASNVFLLGRAGITFDDSNSLYFWTSCNPSTFNVSSSSNLIRLLKISQNPDGSPGSITRVYGGCVAGNPSGDGPFDPLTVVTPARSFKQAAIMVWENGKYIYLRENGHSTSYKILDGVMYRSNISSTVASVSGMLYNPSDTKVYAAEGTVIRSYEQNLTGANGEVSSIFAGGGTAGGCNFDNQPKNTACFSTTSPPVLTAQGKVLLIDGNPGGNDKPYRVRYIDSDDRMQTLLGSLPFYGEGLNKSLMRGRFGGIAWKTGTEPNSILFPEGLYFTEIDGLVIGRIHPTTGNVSVTTGGQWLNASAVATGVTMSPTTNLGGKGQFDLYGFAFDSDGLPWMKNQNRVLRVAANGTFLRSQNSEASWQAAAHESNPNNVGIFYNGTLNNSTIKESEGIFFFGAGGPALGLSTNVSIRYFNFSANTVVRVMGDFTGQASNGVSANSPTPGSIQNLTFSNDCMGNIVNCYTIYRGDQDRLYFNELTSSLRYITEPTTPSLSTLGTLFTTTANRTIQNFTFNPSGSQVFYVSSGQLYCKDLTSGKAWCNETSLGPPAGITLSPQPNQFAWRDASTLYISSGGQILQFNVPP